MLNLIKKEFALCVHPTNYVFLSFVALLLVPNYPYEVVFFFSSLSMFFYCLTSRENSDLQFTCSLPVKKSDVVVARILVCSIFQTALMLLSVLVGVIKCAAFPQEMIINQAGISANLALVGNGALILGIFNIIFFSTYFKNPDKIGIPFVISAVVVFAVIIVLIVLRWVTPLFSTTLNGLNSENTLAKLSALAIGIVTYALLTFIACKLSVKNFLKVDF